MTYIINPYNYEVDSNTLTHIILYGQSLALGSDPDGASVISSTDADHKMFNIGVRAHYDKVGVQANPNTPINPDNVASLSSLAEQLNPDNSTFGETFATGIADKQSTTCLFSSTARGAYKVEDLDREAGGVLNDTNHFQNTYYTALAGSVLAADGGFTYALGPMVFKQGEADGSTAKATWKASVQQLRDDFASHLKWATLTDTSNFKMIVDQQSFSRSGFTYADLAVAAIDLHRDGNGVVCAGPTYPEEFTAITDVHMTSNGYRNYGEKLGRVIDTILGGGAWNPCYITGVSRTGTTITVNIHVPSPPLTTDTTLVASVTDSGFTYTGATITGVSITDTGVGDNAGVIEITIDADAGGTLAYAYNNGSPDARTGPVYGARGNIRDSESAVTTNDGKNLYNWLCNDQWVVT